MNRNKVSEIVTQVQALLEPLDDTTALEHRPVSQMEMF